MMRDALLRFKIEFVLSGGINRIRYTKDSREKRRLILMGCLYVFLGMAMFFYSSLLAVGYAYLGMTDSLPALMTAAVFVLSLILSYLKAGGILFAPKDYDQLLSLPLTTGAIIFGKLLGVYLFNFLAGCVLMLPSLIIFGLSHSPSPTLIIMLALLPILAPLLPMVLASVLSAIIAAVAARFKKSNLVTALLSLVLLFGILILSFYLPTMTQGQITSLAAMADQAITGIYPPAQWIKVSLTTGHPLPFTGFAALSLGALVLFVALLGKFYTRINSAMASHQSGRQARLQDIKAGSPFMALYKRELRRLFSLNVYLVNTCFGALMLAISGLCACLVDLKQLMADAPFSWEMVVAILPMALAAMAVLSSTTYPAISLEGKARWIAASIPVESRVLYQAKLAVNLSILLPAVTIAAVLWTIGIQADPVQFLAMLAVPTAYGCLSAVLGLFLNQRYPRYDWATAYQAVKGGSIPGFATFGIGLPAALLPLALCLILPRGALLISLVAGVLAAAGAAVLYRSLCRKPYFI